MLHQSRLVDLEGKDRYLVSVLRGIINQFLLPNVLLQRNAGFYYLITSGLHQHVNRFRCISINIVAVLMLKIQPWGNGPNQMQPGYYSECVLFDRHIFTGDLRDHGLGPDPEPVKTFNWTRTLQNNDPVVNHPLCVLGVPTFVKVIFNRQLQLFLQRDLGDQNSNKHLFCQLSFIFSFKLTSAK